MVEFAIIVPILLLVIVGVLYLGRVINYTIDETHLANIAARFAVVNNDPYCAPGTPPNSCATGTLANYVKAQAEGELVGSGGGKYGVVQSGSGKQLKVCLVQPSGAGNTQGNPIQATVTTSFQVLPFINWTGTVTETATMMLEQTPDSSIYGCST